jgi:nucleotide-binding universal stress UspA family protein
LSQNKTEFSRLLILVDGSQPSINAADCAISLAKKEHSDNRQELIALYVVFSRLGYAYSPSGTFGSSGLTTPDTVRELLETTKKEAQIWFDNIRQKLKSSNDSNILFQTEVVVTATSIVSAIVEYAKNKDVDLIITGSRGRSEFKKLLLGSVASGVITHASCPVMVVK